MLSPLREDYREKLETLAKKQGVEFEKFDDLDGLVDILSKLLRSTPFRMPFPDAPAEDETASTEESAERRRGRRRRASTEIPEGSEESGESEEASSDSPRDTE
jgi:hypothetical protein